MAERPARRAPPARALLLALAGALLAPRAARGVSLWDQRGAYEVAKASLLRKDPGSPGQSIPAKDHPDVLTVQLQLESRELILSLERNEGLIASGFTETHYQQDGSDVSFTRNYTDHCYYHGHVQGDAASVVSLSTCSGLRGLIVFENKTYILEPMKNTTDRYKLVPAENMKNIQGLCGSHHNKSSLTVEDVFPEPSQMWGRRHKRETLKMTKYVELVIVADNREVRTCETPLYSWSQKECEKVLGQLGLALPRLLMFSYKHWR